MMSKRASTFRKNDIKRGVQALESAGIKVVRVEVQPSVRVDGVEVQPGKIIFFPCKDTTEAEAATAANEWDGAE